MQYRARHRLAVSVILLAAILGFGCANAIKKPTVEVIGVEIVDITLTTIELNLTLTVDNPNPFGATLNRIEYEVEYQAGDEWRPLGAGVREEPIGIRANGSSTFEVPATVTSAELVRALFILLGPGGGELPVKISGEAWLDVELTSVRIPFETTQTISVTFAAGLINALQEALA